jgi:hypothetical protein
MPGHAHERVPEVCATHGKSSRIARGYLDVDCFPGVEHDSALMDPFDGVGGDRAGHEELGCGEGFCVPAPCGS